MIMIQFLIITTYRPVLLVNNEWALGWIQDNNPDLEMFPVPPEKQDAEDDM